MESKTATDLLVVGQGFAGSAVAMTAVLAGMSVHVADGGNPPGATASRVAAGLITPLTGKKINPGWRMEELLAEARAFYDEAGALLGGRFFQACPIHRWFVDEAEAKSFAVRMEEPRIARWVEGMLPPDARVDAPWGGFAMRGGGWLDPCRWLDAVGLWLRRNGMWTEATLEDDAIRVEDDGVHWPGGRARHVVFCNGLAAARSSWFPGLSFRPASGEVLEVRFPQDGPECVWNSGGKWIAPRQDGVWLCGASYGFGEWAPRLRPEGVAELQAWLARLVRIPFHVTAVRTGVRPILQQSRPVAGFHPENPRVAFLNGLGSKGVLTAPWAARQLIAALRDGAPLDPELDLARFPRLPAASRGSSQP